MDSYSPTWSLHLKDGYMTPLIVMTLFLRVMQTLGASTDTECSSKAFRAVHFNRLFDLVTDPSDAKQTRSSRPGSAAALGIFALRRRRGGVFA